MSGLRNNLQHYTVEPFVRSIVQLLDGLLERLLEALAAH
jgi:hypothetical protein